MEGAGEEGIDMIEDSKDLQQQSKAFDKLTEHIEDHQLDSNRVQELNSSKLMDGPSNGSWSISKSLGFVNARLIMCGGDRSFILASGNDVIFIDWVWISCYYIRPAIVFVLKVATAFVWKRMAATAFVPWRLLLHSSPKAATAFVLRWLLLHSSSEGCYCTRPPEAATALVPQRLLLHSSPKGCYCIHPENDGCYCIHPENDGCYCIHPENDGCYCVHLPKAATAFIQKMMADITLIPTAFCYCTNM